MNKKKAYIYSFCLSLIYVGFGTITVLSLYPDDPLFGDWAMNSFLWTLPVTFISLGYRYANPNSYIPVFLIQFGVFILIGWMIYGIFKRKVKDSMEHE